MDIKPENIMIKKGCKQDRLYLIDFGISRSFLRRGNHVQQLSQPKIYGTLKFCSINAGRGMQ